MTLRGGTRRTTLKLSHTGGRVVSVKRTQAKRVTPTQGQTIVAKKAKTLVAEVQLKKTKAEEAAKKAQKKVIEQARARTKKVAAAAKQVLKSVISVKRAVTAKVASITKPVKLTPAAIRSRTVSTIKSLMSKSKELKRATAADNLARLLDSANVRKVIAEQHRGLQTDQLIEFKVNLDGKTFQMKLILHVLN